MTTKAGAVHDFHEGWRYDWMQSGADVNITGVQSNVLGTFVSVPFAHILRRAYFAAGDINVAGTTDVVTLKKSDNNAAAVSIGTLNLIDSAGNPLVSEILLGTDQDSEQVGPTVYFTDITTDNAGDDVDAPALVIAISPIPPGPA